MTNVPLVTIDGEDAKDFDDAVWAEKTDIGFNLIVAIADVSFYVRPGSELDREAYRRGNSVYLPNMVIPMLPEQLCNGLCSLMPLQPRASIVCLMQIDREGQLKGYEFKRAVIRSAARLTYREVQEALDGEKSENIAPVFNGVVLPLLRHIRLWIKQGANAARWIWKVRKSKLRLIKRRYSVHCPGRDLYFQ